MKKYQMASIDVDGTFLATLYVFNPTNSELDIFGDMCKNAIAMFDTHLGSALYNLQSSNANLHQRYEHFDKENFAFFSSYGICAYVQERITANNIDYVLSNWLKAMSIINNP